MGTTLNVRLDGRGLSVAIAVSRFNPSITDALQQGAQDRLTRLGVDAEAIDAVWVPGSFELPRAAQALAHSERYDGVVALGCVIRGDTPHFDYVCRSVTDGLTRVALDGPVPLANGVLTCDTPEQAQARAGLKSNKGAEAAESLIETVRTLNAVHGSQPD
ncbi:MAG: 6,7-dimethyl-8-ribityllumazine synthase [Candidatus Bipolaricaulia bacterium]